MTKKNELMSGPKTFIIYLNKNCNLRCNYCYVHKEKNRVSLNYNQLIKAIDLFFSYKFPKQAIAFLGGEPFLNINEMLEAIRYIRTKDKKIEIMIFTNGTLLNKKNINTLTNYNVRINISIDGRKGTNDLNRKFILNNASVFELIYKNLKNINLKKYKNIYANPIFNTKTLNFLVDNIIFLEKMGFKNIVPDQQLWELWQKKDIENLKLFFIEFKKYLKNSNTNFPMLKEIMEKHPFHRHNKNLWWDFCDNIILGPDGNFYICEYAMGSKLSSAKKMIIGNLKKGIDFEKAEQLISNAKKAIYKNIYNTNDLNYFWFCPMGMYFEYKVKNKKGFKENLNNYHIFSRHFMDGLLWLKFAPKTKIAR